MTLEEIKEAVRQNIKVYWVNDNYQVIESKYEWLIESKKNNHYVGLTNTKGELIEKGKNFYTK